MGIDLLCEIIAQDAKASAKTFQHRSRYEALIGSGLLAEGGIAQSVSCSDCETPHDAEVVHHGGQYGYWCPDIGFVPVDRSTLVGVAPDWKELVARLADVFGCKRRKSTPVRGTTWRVGAIETITGDLTIYVHPRLLTGQDVRDAEAAIRSEIGSAFTIILTAVGSLDVPGANTALLSEVINLDPHSSALIALVNLSAAAGVPPELPGGRPNVFGDRLRAIIASRARASGAISGRNAEASAILEAFGHAFPGERTPSISTIRRYLSEFRSGS